jgi:hypothetical protein
MIYTKTGYIHVLITEGKHFLNSSKELVLTLIDDYVTKICPIFDKIQALHFSVGHLFEDPSVPGEL